MLRLDRTRARSFGEQASLAATLSFVAGWVNASGMIAAASMTSHMSGNVTQLGHALALRASDALVPLRLLLWFLLGAFTATCGVRVLRRWVREPVGGMLVVEAAMLGVLANGAWLSERPAPFAAALCLAMGWQNALITTISGAVIRTTHMTGNLTDLGIELGHVVTERGGLLESWRRLRQQGGESNVARAVLHGSIVGSFLSGATVGPLLWLRFGHEALLGPSVILLAFVALALATRQPDAVRAEAAKPG